MEHQRKGKKVLAVLFTSEMCGVGLALVVCSKTAVRRMGSAKLAQKDTRLV